MKDAETRTHRTADGAEIVYRLRPGPDPFVLLHAFGCDGSMWDGVVAALPGGRGLLIPDLRGHGASTLGWRPPGIDLWARDVIEILAAEGLERPAIAGISMGGYTAMAVASQRPEAARAWGFVSTQAGPDDEAGRLRRAEDLATLRRRGWRSLAAGLVSSLLSEQNPDFPRHRGALMAMFGRAGEAGLASALLALANRPDRRESLRALRAVAVAVAGDADLLIPPDRAREIAAAIPGAKLILLPGIAHLSVMEAPREVAEALTCCG